MYATELRQSAWRSTPLASRIVMVVGALAAAVALWASSLAAIHAQAAVERVEQEGLERDFALCTNSNEARAGVLGFIESLAPPPELLTPQQQETLALAREVFGQKPCPPDPSP